MSFCLLSSKRVAGSFGIHMLLSSEANRLTVMLPQAGLVFPETHVITSFEQEISMAKKKKAKRVAWTAAVKKELKQYSKAKMPVAKISKVMKRTAGALRQQAQKMGIPLGHRR
jgi:hypothetical protein